MAQWWLKLFAGGNLSLEDGTAPWMTMDLG
jgi:hypothetical protein